MSESRSRVALSVQLRGMGRMFWVANAMEALERLAFYGVRAVLPLYMVDSASGGLGLSFSEKGLIYMVWALLQCLVPMVSGGYTESYGYRRSLFVAFALNLLGYGLMAHANGFAMMMAAGIAVGVGTAIFKPAVQGVVARSLNEGNSSLGFGIFYWIVNIGGVIAPMAASWARGNEDAPTWSWVFYGAAAVTALNYLPAILLFQEPEKQATAGRSPWQVFTETLGVLWRDKALLRFLLVISGFWFMFMQIWDLLPNFLAEWVDARDVGGLLRALLGDGAEGFLSADGAAKPEILINIDSATVVLLVLPVTWLAGRFRMIATLLVGMAVSVVGFVGAGMSQAGALAGLFIFVFAIGEILCSPKFHEYIGMTAPAEQKALYMGYANIPFAIGWAAGNGLSGPLYEALASKAAFARAYLLEHGASAAELEAIPPAELIDHVALSMGDGTTAREATAMLWAENHPWLLWVVLGAVGLVSLVGMVALYRRARE